MTLRSTERFSSSTRRKSRPVRTKQRSCVVAVTVAVRFAVVSRAISPTNSPAERVASGLPLRVTAAVPSRITKNSPPVLPSLQTTVPAGTTVRWVWGSGAVGHNITPVGGAEPAGTPGASNSAPFVHEHTFNTPGVYSYECTNHVGMTGTITVQ